MHPQAAKVLPDEISSAPPVWLRQGAAPFPLVVPEPARATPLPTPGAVSESVLSWVRNPSPAALALRVAGWGTTEWETVRSTALIHGIAPLLYQLLHSTPTWGALPAEMQGWLHERYTRNDERIRLMKGELVAVLHAAHAARIPVMPLKGSALVFHFYDNPALRPMADLDLLVHPEDEASLSRCLLALGYRAIEETPRHRSYTLQPEEGRVVTEGDHPDTPRDLEIHTEAREEFWGIEYDVTAALWPGRLACFGGVPAWLPEPVALMQHLLIHTSTDVIAGKARLIRLYDLVRVGAHLDGHAWERLQREAQQRGEERLLYVPLRLAQRYLPLAVPVPVMAALAAGTPPALRRWVEHVTLSHVSFCNPLALSLAERLAWHRPGAERARAILRRLLPPPSDLRQLHPHLARAHGMPLAYLAHLGDLADGLWRRLWCVPRRPWLRRGTGGK